LKKSFFVYKNFLCDLSGQRTTTIYNQITSLFVVLQMEKSQSQLFWTANT